MERLSIVVRRRVRVVLVCVCVCKAESQVRSSGKELTPLKKSIPGFAQRWKCTWRQRGSFVKPRIGSLNGQRGPGVVVDPRAGGGWGKSGAAVLTGGREGGVGASALCGSKEGREIVPSG